MDHIEQAMGPPVWHACFRGRKRGGTYLYLCRSQNGLDTSWINCRLYGLVDIFSTSQFAKNKMYEIFFTDSTEKVLLKWLSNYLNWAGFEFKSFCHESANMTDTHLKWALVKGIEGSKQVLIYLNNTKHQISWQCVTSI